MQELCGKILLLKHKLTSEEDCFGMPSSNLFTQLQGGCHDFRPDPMDRLGTEAMVLHVVHIASGFPVHGGAEVADLLAPFEVPRIDNADLGEDKVREHSWEHSLNTEQGVDAQAVEAVDEKHCRPSFWIKRRRGGENRSFRDSDSLFQCLKSPKLPRDPLVVALDQETATSDPVTTRVIQPPWWNLMALRATRIVAVSRKPSAFTASFERHEGSERR